MDVNFIDNHEHCREAGNLGLNAEGRFFTIDFIALQAVRRPVELNDPYVHIVVTIANMRNELMGNRTRAR